MIIPAHLLVSLFAGPDLLTVERLDGHPSGDVNALGAIESPSPALIELRIAVHQVNREQLERAGLDHTHDWRQFYCQSELRTAGSAGPADVVQYAGDRWQLHNVADYDTLGGIYSALGMKIE